jgi:hypothetical protein
MDSVIVLDNFLPLHNHKEIQHLMLGEEGTFPWFYNKSRVSKLTDDGDYDYQFTHTFYHQHRMCSDYFNSICSPFIEQLKPLALLRIKANLIMKTPENFISDWHVDYDGFAGTTAIYYVETTNGKTHFKNRESVNCIANRLVMFPANFHHAGETCTDAKKRAVINFNFVSQVGNLTRVK